MKRCILTLVTVFFTILSCFVINNLRLQSPSQVSQSEYISSESMSKVKTAEENQTVETRNITPVPDNQQENSTDQSSDNNETGEKDSSSGEVPAGRDNRQDSISLTYENTKSSEAYENVVQETQSMLTLKEKLYLIGIVRYLDKEDFSLMKYYVINGATQQELDSLWEGIRGKVPKKDYDKMYAIFLKYKR